MNRFVYSVLLYLILPFVPLKLLWRGIKQPEYRQHWGERFGFYNAKVTKPVIWLHCVSVGETRAAEPLVKALQLQYPSHQILLSHGTPTGRDTSKALFGDLVTSVYLPYDLPFAVNGFLKHFKPSIGLLMETELWFNLIAACKQREIPLLLVNARLSESSANAYAKLGKLIREGLQNLSAIATQTADDADRLKLLGATNISIDGNLKYDAKAPASLLAQGERLRASFGEKRFVLVCASTREGEEALLLPALKALAVTQPQLLVLLVPRHPQRFAEVANLLQSQHIKFVYRSDLLQGTQISQTLGSHVQFVLGNSMGELFTYYAASDIAFVGGSLLPLGGQNLIEPLSLQKPVLIGPHTFNFADASARAKQLGAAIEVSSVNELAEKIEILMQNQQQRDNMAKAATAFNNSVGGATPRMMHLISHYL